MMGNRARNDDGQLGHYVPGTDPAYDQWALDIERQLHESETAQKLIESALGANS